jgi:hypothetical protein
VAISTEWMILTCSEWWMKRNKLTAAIFRTNAKKKILGREKE